MRETENVQRGLLIHRFHRCCYCQLSAAVHELLLSSDAVENSMLLDLWQLTNCRETRMASVHTPNSAKQSIFSH